MQRPPAWQAVHLCLIHERAPQARSLPRDEALAELARRYFTSHGPATSHDFAAWSGLTIADAKLGLEMVKSCLFQEEIDGKTFWYASSDTIAHAPSPTVHLLPTYDEYAIVMRDGSLIYDPAYSGQWRDLPFFGLIVIDGIIVGNWRRTLSKKAVTIESAPFRPFTPPKMRLSPPQPSVSANSWGFRQCWRKPRSYAVGFSNKGFKPLVHAQSFLQLRKS